MNTLKKADSGELVTFFFWCYNACMKSIPTAGIIGGLGPASTVDYYNGIIKQYRAATTTDEYPHILINSVNMTDMIKSVADENYDELTLKLLTALEQLKRAGADFACMACNTTHIVFDSLKAVSPLPLISIVESAAQYALSRGFKRSLLTGTLFTMNNTFYQKEFKQKGLTCIVPTLEQRKCIQDIIFPDLENGIITQEMKEAFTKICVNIIQEQNDSHTPVDAVILGCTELPLLIHEGDLPLPLLNTTDVHIAAITQKLFQP